MESSLPGRLHLVAALLASTALSCNTAVDSCSGLGGDTDGDGICDAVDNCVAVANAGQEDGDGDQIGDACAPTRVACDALGGDSDGDGVCNWLDNCPAVANADQQDSDADRIGDACDVVNGQDPCAGKGGDPDGDEICSLYDNCPSVANLDQLDADGDGIGDACDTTPGRCDELGGDADGDGVCDLADNCPDVPNAAQADFDHDGIGDACDTSTPPPDPMACDGLGGDPDFDDFCTLYDDCPDVYDPDQTDTDGDGVGDACDVETCDGLDNDGDGTVDETFPDSDGDGVADCVDVCPGIPDVDSDGDGIVDCRDACPADPRNDEDGDTICGDVDNCPTVSNRTQADVDGDGIGNACDAETCDGVDNDGDGQIDEGYPDGDGDGMADCVDPCPADPVNDDDGDGICGAEDNCPLVANPSQADSDCDGQGDACETLPLSSNWPTARGDVAHSSHSPGSILFPDFEEDWSYAFGGALHHLVSDGTRVIASGRTVKRVDAISAETGVALWKHDFGSVFSIGGPTLDGDYVYVAQGDSSNTKIFKLDASSGSIAALSSMGGQWEMYLAPIVVDGNVYINGGTYGGLYSFTTATLTQRWFATLAQYDEWSPGYMDGTVYAWVAGKLTAHRPADGVQLWSATIPYSWHGYSMDTSVVLTPTRVFAFDSGSIYAVDLSTHALVWTFSPSIVAMPAVDGDEVYVVGGGVLWVRQASTGDALWQFAPPAGETLGRTPALTDDWVFVSSQTRVYAVSRTTHEAVVVAHHGGDVILDQTGLYVAEATGLVHHYRLVDGREALAGCTP